MDQRGSLDAVPDRPLSHLVGYFFEGGLTTRANLYWGSGVNTWWLRGKTLAFWEWVELFGSFRSVSPGCLIDDACDMIPSVHLAVLGPNIIEHCVQSARSFGMVDINPPVIRV